MSTPQTETAKVIRGPGITPAPDRSIGAMLMDSGKITPDEAERVLRYAKDKNLRFGDAAQALRLVTAEDIQQVLDKLPRHYAAVLLLRHYQGLSLAETAAALDITENAAKLRLFRARKAFAELYDEPADGDPAIAGGREGRP